MVFPWVFLWILDPVARHGRRPQGRRVGALRQGTAFSHEKREFPSTKTWAYGM